MTWNGVSNLIDQDSVDHFYTSNGNDRATTEDAERLLSVDNVACVDALFVHLDDVDNGLAALGRALDAALA